MRVVIALVSAERADVVEPVLRGGPVVLRQSAAIDARLARLAQTWPFPTGRTFTHTTEFRLAESNVNVDRQRNDV
jgi:hypothetical protein